MEVAVTEFPFVAELPKREAKHVKSLWEELEEMTRVSEENGFLLPPAAAAELLGVTRQRVAQYQADGRLRVWTFRGRPFVCGNDIVALAESERAVGVHINPPKNYREAAQVALRVARATLQKS